MPAYPAASSAPHDPSQTSYARQGPPPTSQQQAPQHPQSQQQQQQQPAPRGYYYGAYSTGLPMGPPPQDYNPQLGSPSSRPYAPYDHPPYGPGPYDTPIASYASPEHSSAPPPPSQAPPSSSSQPLASASATGDRIAPIVPTTTASPNTRPLSPHSNPTSYPIHPQAHPGVHMQPPPPHLVHHHQPPQPSQQQQGGRYPPPPQQHLQLHGPPPPSQQQQQMRGSPSSHYDPRDYYPPTGRRGSPPPHMYDNQQPQQPPPPPSSQQQQQSMPYMMQYGRPLPPHMQPDYRGVPPPPPHAQLYGPPPPQMHEYHRNMPNHDDDGSHNVTNGPASAAATASPYSRMQPNGPPQPPPPPPPQGHPAQYNQYDLHYPHGNPPPPQSQPQLPPSQQKQHPVATSTTTGKYAGGSGNHPDSIQEDIAGQSTNGIRGSSANSHVDGSNVGTDGTVIDTNVTTGKPRAKRRRGASNATGQTSVDDPTSGKRQSSYDDSRYLTNGDTNMEYSDVIHPGMPPSIPPHHLQHPYDTSMGMHPSTFMDHGPHYPPPPPPHEMYDEPPYGYPPHYAGPPGPMPPPGVMGYSTTGKISSNGSIPLGSHPIPPLPMMAGMIPPEPEYELTRTQKRHLEIKERIEALERTFLSNREDIFKEKLNEFKESVKKLQDGTDITLVAHMRELKKRRDLLIANAVIASDYMINRAKSDYEYESEKMEKEYEMEKDAVKTKLLDEIQERKRLLREARDNFDISAENFVDSATAAAMGVTIATINRLSRKSTRASKFTGGNSNQTTSEERRSEKRSRNQKPAIQPFVLLATDTEIFDDLSIIRGKSSGRGQSAGNTGTTTEEVTTASGRRVGSRRR